MKGMSALAGPGVITAGNGKGHPMKTGTVLTLLAAAMLANTATAAPPPPGLADDMLRNGRLLNYLESYADARGRGVDAPSPLYADRTPFGPRGAISGGRDSTEMNVLILLVDFSDKEAQTDAVYFDSMGYAADTLSLSSHYYESSMGQLDIVTVNWPSGTGWNRAPQPYDYYADDNYGWGSYPQNSQGLVEDVCELADPVVDFTDYDNDGDGYVDGVNVIYAGTFDGSPQMIWPHMWVLPGGGIDFDGVTVYSFSVQNEYDSNPGDKSASVICHEFGHVLGLPDFYDYDYDSHGIGKWGLMAYGVYNGGSWSPAHPCAWSRIDLGFTEAVNVTAAGTYEVPPVQTSGTVYRLWTDGAAGYQYFLLANRRPVGYDTALPGHGVLIWHVDDTQNSNDHQWYPGYTEHGHYQLALEQADGLWQLEKYTSAGDPGDPYPGSTGNAFFHHWSTPDSDDYDFQPTFVYVGPVPETADTVEVFMDVSYTGVEEGASSGGGLLSLTGSNPVSGRVELELRLESPARTVVEVMDLSGRLVATPVDGRLSAGDHSASWSPEGTPAGVYLVRATSGGRSETARLVLLR
jgi:immune inhibitor A